MMRNFNEKNEFMNDENNETSGGERERESRRRRARSHVVPYADADEELKAKMDKIMQPIDKAPDSFEVILMYGNEPIQELGKIANSMIAVQKRFDEHVNVMNTTVEDVKTKLRSMNLKEMVGIVAKSAADAGAKAGKGTWNIFKAISDGVTGAKAKRTEEEKLVAEMQEKLPGMLDEMLRMIQTVQKVDDGIKEVMKEAERLGLARVEATRGLNMYLGTKEEVERRYREEYVPYAQQDFEETADPDDEIYLTNVKKRELDFADRMVMLEGSRAQGISQAQTLKQMMDTMETQRKILQNMIHNGQNEWKAMLMAAGIAGSSLKAAETIKKAHEFGDGMYQDTMKMTEMAHEMTLNAETRGSVDPKLIVEGLQRMEKMLEKTDEVRAQKQLESEQMRQQLRGAADKLLEAANASESKRLLEGASTDESTRKRDQGKNTSNDNAADAAANDKPRRKSNGPEV